MARLGSPIGDGGGGSTESASSSGDSETTTLRTYIREQRRDELLDIEPDSSGGSASETDDTTDSSSGSPSSATDIQDIRVGEIQSRTTPTGSTGGGGSSSGDSVSGSTVTDTPELPEMDSPTPTESTGSQSQRAGNASRSSGISGVDDINQGRRGTGSSVSEPQGLDASNMPPSVRRPPSQGQTAKSSSGSASSGELQGVYVGGEGLEGQSGDPGNRARQVEQEVIGDTPFLTDENQIRINPDTGEVELTPSGRKAQRKYRQGEFAEQVAGEEPGLTASEVEVDLDAPGGPDITITERGRAQLQGLVAAPTQGGLRQIQEGSVKERFAGLEGPAVSVDEVQVTESNDGTLDVGITEMAPVVASQQGGLRDIQAGSIKEATARGSDDLTTRELTADLTETGANPTLTLAATRAKAEESILESNPGLEASDIDVTANEDGVDVDYTDAYVKDQATQNILEENPNLSEGDFTVNIEDRSGGGPILSDSGKLIADPVNRGGPQVELTESGKEKLIVEQIAEERQSVTADEVDVTFDDDGAVADVEIEEQFGDDGGRVFGIKGLEDDFDAAAQKFSEAAATTGKKVGMLASPADAAVQPLSNIKEIPNVEDPFQTTFEKGTTGALNIVNVPSTIRGLDEAGEFIGGYAASGLTVSADYDNLSDGQGQVFGTKEETFTEFESGAIAAGERKFDDFAEQVETKPLATGAAVAGSLLGSYGIIRGASAVGPRAGGAARYAIQPGEELAGLGGFRATKAVAGQRAADRFFPNKEPVIFSEEAAISGARYGGGKIRSAAGGARGKVGDLYDGSRAQATLSRIQSTDIEDVMNRARLEAQRQRIRRPDEVSTPTITEAELEEQGVVLVEDRTREFLPGEAEEDVDVDADEFDSDAEAGSGDATVYTDVRTDSGQIARMEQRMGTGTDTVTETMRTTPAELDVETRRSLARYYERELGEVNTALPSEETMALPESLTEVEAGEGPALSELGMVETEEVGRLQTAQRSEISQTEVSDLGTEQEIIGELDTGFETGLETELESALESEIRSEQETEAETEAEIESELKLESETELENEPFLPRGMDATGGDKKDSGSEKERVFEYDVASPDEVLEGAFGDQ